MNRRSGLTLIEVLVAIFVMGIGMIALLTLFPIGVLQMANAIRQDKVLRSAQAADTYSILPLGIDAMKNLVSLRYDAPMSTNPAAIFGGPKGVAWPPFEMDASFFTSYSLPTAAGGLLSSMPPADPYGASYPIMVDPHGVLASAALAPKVRPWIGGIAPVNASVTGTTGGLMRRPVSFAGSMPLIKQWFSLPDDIVFDNDPFPGSPLPGTPKLVAATTMMRDTPFSWTYVLQRPRTGDTSVVNCTIVVWENRPLLGAGVANVALPEFVFTGGTVGNPVVKFDTNANTVTITSAAIPTLRPGDWLYDATIILPNAGAAPPLLFPEIVSAFYRVVAVDEVPGGFRYEVQQPIKVMVNDPGFAMTPRQRLLPGTVIVMEGISEVFDRGPVRVP